MLAAMCGAAPVYRETPGAIFDIIPAGCGRTDGVVIMPLARPGLQNSRTFGPKQRKFSPLLVLGILLFATANSSWAEEASAVITGKPNPLYPDEAQITFQWNYACPENRPCTFVCRGAGGGGGSDHVTRLDIYLGTLPLNGVQQERAAAIFYDFSSREFPHSSGFAISTGINSLSCQVNGMILNHSGPPPNKSKPGADEKPGPTDDVPVSQNRG